MAVFSGTYTLLLTKILINFLLLSHLVIALDESGADPEADLLDRHRRAVVTDSVAAPNVVPENVNATVTLYDLTDRVPSRTYVVTNNSADTQGMFQVTNGKLTLASGLSSDRRKLFDYEKFKTFEVMINATNQTDPKDVVILTVRIPLSDINDEPPVFSNKPKPFYATLSQNASPGTVVYTMTVTDADSNPDLDFNIDQVTLSDQTVVTPRFQVAQPSSGSASQKVYSINTVGSGSFQSGADYTIKISAQDKNTAAGSPVTSDTIVVRIGTRPPQFFEQSYKGRIYENTVTSTTNWVLEADTNNKLGIQVLQYQPGNALTFQLLEQGGTQSRFFDIQAEDGVQRIVNKIPVDYEAFQAVSLTIQVTEANTGLTNSVPILLNIIDENDNSPVFFAPQYSATVREDLPIGSSVFKVTASDRDSGLNGELVFWISNSTYFNVTTERISNAYTGTAIVKSPLDYDLNPSPIQFNMMASDKGTPPLSTPVQVTLTLLNVNDNPPTIDNSTNPIKLNETSTINSVVTLVQASDIDGDAVKFYFEGRVNTSEIFTIRDTNGQIVLNAAIPKNKDLYILKVIAVDDDSCCTVKTGFKTATATFTVNIVDINLNKPSFNNCLQYDTSASVKEKAPVGTPVIQVSAIDPDRGENGVVVYRIESPDPSLPDAVFQIDSSTGNITVKGSISRENYEVIQVTVVGRNPPLFPMMEGRCTFRVTVIDINDHNPTFRQTNYEIPVSISISPPSIITQMVATDQDVGSNANVTYSFAMNDTAALDTFTINTLSGVIQLKKALDSSVASYILIVVADDNGKDPGPRYGTATVTVIINLDDRKPPEWIYPPANSNNLTYNISENVARGFVIATLSCKSNTNQTEVEYRVYDAGSSINSDSSNFMAAPFVENDVSKMNLLLRSPVDFEVKNVYKLSIVCQSFGAVVLRAPLLTPVINVLDANDELPEFLGLDANGRYRGTVAENAPSGESVLQVTARDKDTTEAFNYVSFALVGPNKDFFRIVNLSGNRADIVTTDLLKLDRETLAHYTVEIVAQDGAPASPPNLINNTLPNRVTRFIDVFVTDINDNPPVFPQPLYTFNVSENAAVTSIVGVVTATDPDEIDQGLGLDYRFTSGNTNNAFNIFSITGQIRCAKKLDYENLQEPRIYNLTLVALDQNQLHSAETMVRIQLLDENDNRPAFSLSQYNVKDVVTEEDKSITPQNPLFLVKVTATDADVDRPQTIRYSLFGASQSGAAQLFTIEAETGNVYLIGSLDRDIPPFFYTITVEAQDEPENPLSSFVDVLIYPMDINDNKPEFNQQYLQGSVLENSANKCVMTVVAVDKDAGNNQTVRYRAAPVQPNATLSSLFIVTENGDVCTASDVALLDRETLSQVFLVVQAYDLGTPTSKDANETVTITVLDVNDQSPFFENSLYSASVSEHLTSGMVLKVPAKDLDSDPRNRQLLFNLQGNSNETKFFSVQSTGSEAIIRLEQAIDYETDPHVMTFTLVVTDGAPGHTNTTTVKITVLDYNDNKPVFSNPVQSITLVEEEAPGKVIATFSATDADEGINAEIGYSILRASDPRYEFYIEPKTGVVTTRKRLDREIQESMTIIIHATDKGEQPLTGTATLSITLNDTNDNAPRFRENYRPVVQENEDHNNYLVQVIHATDPDTLQYGPPFGFRFPTGCSVPACTYFNLTFDSAGDGGNGTATVRTSFRFDREERKYYYLPIVMWDMDGKSLSQTATNTLTITIGDENDNTLEPGHQDIVVYNYEGRFTEIEIGRVFANDPDDWDLPDKTFTYLSPDVLKAYFSVNPQTGMITLKPGLSPNNFKDPYQFSVTVFDKKFQKTVTCTVSVNIQQITDEAVRKSGGVRLQGITAEEFIKPVSSGTPNAPSTSKYQQFRQAVSQMLGYPNLNSIEIVSLTDGEGFLDVRFSAHDSPYVNPSQGESAIMLNQAKFEQAVGVTVAQVPINLCMNENSDIGCYNYLNVTGKPALINSNGTSYVVMKTSLTSEEGCVDSMFPDPVECRGDYCFNGGTCIKDDWGKLSCACSAGFDGPRCQQRRHSFDGTSAAFYQGLSACSVGRTSIDFITLQENGLLMYSGPITIVDQTQDAQDYLILELKTGYPSLRLNLGGSEVTLQLTGKDNTGAVKMDKLSDGQWHHVDIDRDNQRVTLTVDHCKSAVSTNGTVLDWSPCRISDVVPGPDILLNVHSHLQLGGRYPNSPFLSYPPGVTNTGFSGCLRNLVHNTKLYDLYYRQLPSWNSGNNGCPKEETICGQGTTQPMCGQNATCEASLQSSQVLACRCNPGWYGDKCAKEAPTKDLQINSYFAWELKQTLIDETKRAGSFQMMFRTRKTSGTLFVLTNAELKTILLQLVNGKLSLSYDMGQGLTKLELGNAPANSGQWSTVRVERYGNEFLLIMDGGEGRNFNYQIANTGLEVFFEAQPRVTVGALVTGGNQISEDLTNTCVRDIRFNDHWLPLTPDQNSDPDAGARLYQSQGVVDGCRREDCAGVPCTAPLICYPLWETHDCRCAAGGSFINGVCVGTCNPNPCQNSGVCSIVSGKPQCTCASGWAGPTCVQGLIISDDAGLGAGAIAGIVIGILLLLILLIILIIFLLTRKRSEKERIIEVDPEDDFIRENVIFYDEEGAGEEDHAAYDIKLLQRPLRETSAKPVFSPVTNNEMRVWNAPRVDRPDVAPRPDRPDVGSFIKDRINEAEDDDPLTDSTREFNFEGGNSDAGSLSSLNTSSSGGSQDYDYLSDWGPKFAKLADMYGAGQNLEDA